MLSLVLPESDLSSFAVSDHLGGVGVESESVEEASLGHLHCEHVFGELGRGISHSLGRRVSQSDSKCKLLKHIYLL